MPMSEAGYLPSQALQLLKSEEGALQRAFGSRRW
jgi:hypothetical protein